MNNEKNEGKGWSSRPYSESNAEMWVRCFEKLYRRASKGLQDLSGIKREDVIKLAMYSQVGWELYKSLVKELKKVDDLYSDESIQLFPRVYEADMGHTIRLFSRNVAIALAELKISFKNEYQWLTWWYSRII